MTISWEVPSTRNDDHLSGNEEGQENNGEDLDALATAQAEALASLATANRTLTDARENQHQARMSRGYSLLSNRTNAIVPTGGKSEHASSAAAHSAHSEFTMAVRTDMSLFAGEALETGKALIDCSATRSVASWEAVDGLARMKQQRHGSTRFSGWHTEDVVHLCK